MYYAIFCPTLNKDFNNNDNKIYSIFVTGMWMTSWTFILEKIKLILSFSKLKTEKKSVGELYINCGNIKIKENPKITYLGCELEGNL